MCHGQKYMSPLPDLSREESDLEQVRKMHEVAQYSYCTRASMHTGQKRGTRIDWMSRWQGRLKRGGDAETDLQCFLSHRVRTIPVRWDPNLAKLRKQTVHEAWYVAELSDPEY